MDSTTRQAQEQAQVVPGDTEQLTATQEEEEEDYFSTDPDVIFRRECSKLDTIPLKHAEPTTPWPSLLLFAAFFLSVVGGAALGIVTYPSVTIDLVPVTRRVTLTTPLARLSIRTLAPVTLTRTLSQPTTGHGHQDATTAAGLLTFYNGRFSSQTLTRGSVLTGSDGIQVATDAAVTIPAASTQQVGTASVAAHALRAGSQGNIPALAINLAISGDLLVKNLAAFAGGNNARNYPAVAKADIESLTAALQHTLSQSIVQAFAVAPGEAVTPTHCTLVESTDHALGQEATAVTEQARYTCTGIAYDIQELQQSATSAFAAATRPGSNYELVGSVQTRVTAGETAVTASIRGLWVYRLSEDYKQFLAQQLAGDSQEQASAYLLATGFITCATVPAGQLPKDPAHIHFETLIGL